MANWVTLPNGVHIDLDDPNNPLTGEGTFESYLGGNDEGYRGSTPKGSKIKLGDKVKFKGESGIVKQVTKDEDGFLLKVDFNGDTKYISDFDLDRSPAGNESSKVDFKADPTMSGKDSKSFDRDLELAFKEFDGDEDAILDALRSTGKDYGMSNSDLQAVVESYVLTHNKPSDNEMSVFAMAKEMGMSPADVGSYNRSAITKMYNDWKSKSRKK